jgi:UDP-N-acetylmuramate--alanine ligase
MRIYCCGIGGIGLSAYAALQKEMGHDVCGSDQRASLVTDDLVHRGIPVFTNQDGSMVKEGIDVLVYSEAVPYDAPERQRARDLHIPELSYPAAVGQMTQGKHVIAVCGTHGKSSTTAMIAHVLATCGMDPTVIVGTRIPQLQDRNWRLGKSNIVVLEACEYCKSFLHYQPTIVAVTTCDGDHFDYYSTLEEYRSAFTDFLRLVPQNGHIVVHGNDEQCTSLVENMHCAIHNADTRTLPMLRVPGAHMRQNAQLALTICDLLNISKDKSDAAIATFAGTWRRMELCGFMENAVPVIDDYAHHPREITATLSALREQYKNQRLICIFQPHTHHRTIALRQSFTTAFAEADVVYIPNVYAARSDRDGEQIDIASFCHDIQEGSDVRVEHTVSLNKTEEILRANIKEGDVIVCMGAGDITSLARKLVTTTNED